MGRRDLFALLVALSLAAGCGGSPSAPSMAAATSSLSAESAVMSAMSQAMSQIALAGRTIGDPSTSFSFPCAGGGSIVFTLGPRPQELSKVYKSSARIEYNDCRNQTVTLNGDPHLETSSEHAFPNGPGAESVSTTRTVGGLRIDTGAVQGRVRFDCTTTVTIQMVNGTSQFSATSSGIITFEQPIGSAPVVRPCGPS